VGENKIYFSEAKTLDESETASDGSLKLLQMTFFVVVWATLIKIISALISNKYKVYAQRQEACRKDVDYIMRACIVLHNMIIMDEKGVDLPTIHTSEWPGCENPLVSTIADFIDAQTYI
jgi:hypothetical protein